MYRLFGIDYFDSVLATGMYKEKDVRWLEEHRGIKHKEIVSVVEDSGPGMDEETKKYIYHRGFSTKGDTGHGFGLFLAKQSVDSLEGTISVESSPGEGTVFTVRLPVKKEVD